MLTNQLPSPPCATKPASTRSNTLPPDAHRMIARWETLGRPCIDLQPGISISNLERWLHKSLPAPRSHLGIVREYLFIDSVASAAPPL